LPSVQLRRRGRAARLGSAKAPTPVRIRTMPLKEIQKCISFFYILSSGYSSILNNFFKNLKKTFGFFVLIFEKN
jgi:hypothetical protein